MSRRGFKWDRAGAGRRWVPAVLAATGMLVSGQLLAATNVDKLGQLENSWSDASLQVELLTEDNSSSVVAEDPVRYRLTAQHAGACYLVHVDAEDHASLLRPEDCASLQPGESSHFPSAGTLRASAPWGAARAPALLLPAPLPPAAPPPTRTRMSSGRQPRRTRTSSSPGVLMRTASGRPSTTTCKGSSTATISSLIVSAPPDHFVI